MRINELVARQSICDRGVAFIISSLVTVALQALHIHNNDNNNESEISGAHSIFYRFAFVGLFLWAKSVKHVDFEVSVKRIFLLSGTKMIGHLVKNVFCISNECRCQDMTFSPWNSFAYHMATLSNVSQHQLSNKHHHSLRSHVRDSFCFAFFSLAFSISLIHTQSLSLHVTTLYFICCIRLLANNLEIGVVSFQFLMECFFTEEKLLINYASLYVDCYFCFDCCHLFSHSYHIPNASRYKYTYTYAYNVPLFVHTFKMIY